MLVLKTLSSEVRDAWGLRALEDLAADLRFAARTLAKSPTFTIVAVLTLALGIGANTAIFSLVNGVLLRPLPYAMPDRLVQLWPEGSFPRGGVELLGERSRAYERLSGVGYTTQLVLNGRGEPERLTGAPVAPDLFATLGVSAAIGRTLRPGEQGTGRDGVVVLSHGLWQRRFGGDPKVLGSGITLGGVDRTVVGVMPPGFVFPSRDVEFWIPAPYSPDDPTLHWDMGWLRPVGRLRPGATVEQARAELNALMPEVRAGFPWHMPGDWGAGADAVPMRDAITGNVRRMLLVLLGAVALVLLVACVNVGNLLLARSATRRKEMAVRAALGAGRGRLVRQLLTESLLLALLGGAAGLLLAMAALPALTALLPADMPRLEEVGLDGRVLGFTLALAVLTGVGFGLVPAWRVLRPNSNLHQGLQDGGNAGTSRRRWRLVSGLVAAEVALSVVLVVGALLLVKSVWLLLRVDPGFQRESVVTASVDPPEFRYGDRASRQVFYQELLRRLNTLPGADVAAVATAIPFSGTASHSIFLIEGRPEPGTGDSEWPLADARLIVSPEYFRALGIPILEGRGFTEGDGEGAQPVALVSRKLADSYWPGEGAIGRRIKFPWSKSWSTIVGVVGDVKWDRLSAEAGKGLYLPMLQSGIGPMRIVVRTGDAGEDAVLANLRPLVASLDKDTPVSDVGTLEQLVSASAAESRSIMLLLGLFALVALALGAVGIYGVIAYAVSQRRREIGIRLALGARAGQILWLVLWQGAILAALGIALGLLGAFGATRVLQSLLFEVSATDPVTFATVAVLLAAVALLASYLPGRRAARVDPTRALRSE
jgi:predicted permease